MHVFRYYGLTVALSSLLFLSGCDTAVVTNGNIMGIQSGQFLYTNGYLQADYLTNLDSVWQACEQTLQDLKATNIRKDRKIASGTLKADVYDDKIVIEIVYSERDRVTVSVLAGIGGSQLAARLIHERIGKALHAMGAIKSS
ncbi:MAG: hypothetical protein A4E70_02282 [Syntrophus sp. PtaU1.Bin005]|uniref:DUF3568 family protein n=1 Tax=Syntrophus TaxID=43773 RepID=UPI0009C98050|nr:MAG: hypothetical protein A4E69_01220 [Syntrophus sp. PtaB.Bin138]OPY78914.1 MAG: hypothetical protein A4E70_02282 [Syntrophus sp. PtaU1.Bin005]